MNNKIQFSAWYGLLNWILIWIALFGRAETDVIDLPTFCEAYKEKERHIEYSTGILYTSRILINQLNHKLSNISPINISIIHK